MTLGVLERRRRPPIAGASDASLLQTTFHSKYGRLLLKHRGYEQATYEVYSYPHDSTVRRTLTSTSYEYCEVQDRPDRQTRVVAGHHDSDVRPEVECHPTGIQANLRALIVWSVCRRHWEATVSRELTPYLEQGQSQA